MCGVGRGPVGEPVGCGWLAQVQPEAAYRCEECSLPRFDPGAELRAALDLYGYLHEYREDSPVGEYRWRRFLASTEPRRAEMLLGDMEVVSEVVEGARRERQAAAIRRGARRAGRPFALLAGGAEAGA